MKYYSVKLSWMLITKVMHYLLINGSSLFWARDGTSKWMIIRYMQNALLGSGNSTGEGSKDSRGEWIHCCKANSCVTVSSVDMVTRHKSLFYWSGWNENALFIFRSLIMNPPKAGWEAEVWSVQVKALLLRIHITYFILQFDLRVCNKLLAILKSWDSQNNIVSTELHWHIKYVLHQQWLYWHWNKPFWLLRKNFFF